jgi:hypothetical protein
VIRAEKIPSPRHGNGGADVSVKEQLEELLGDIQRNGNSFDDIERYGMRFPDTVSNEDVTDHLIANGVTIQRWIPVGERLPDLIPCSAGTGYSEAVNVLTSGRKVMVAVWDGVDWLCAMDYWDAWGEVITHWTPVLLPLPEPPKGE